METSLIVGLVSSLFGGFIVTLTTYLAGRNKIAAEIRKLDAEAEKSKAETTKLLAELDGKMTKKTNSPDTKAPNGWLERGSDPENYEFGVDKDVAIQGSGSGFIWSTPNARGFGTLMQMFKADLYCGKRRRRRGLVERGGAGLRLVKLRVLHQCGLPRRLRAMLPAHRYHVHIQREANPDCGADTAMPTREPGDERNILA